MGKHHLSELIEQHQKLVVEAKRLHAEIEAERRETLAKLPSQYGYDNLDAFIVAIRKASVPVKTRQPHRGIAKAQTGVAASTESLSKASVSSAPTLPTGTSLDDPKSFGMMPDLSVLQADGRTARDQHSRLVESMSFTQRVLHTSGVPAAVWREWRQFEAKINDALSVLNAAPRVMDV